MLIFVEHLIESSTFCGCPLGSVMPEPIFLSIGPEDLYTILTHRIKKQNSSQIPVPNLKPCLRVSD